MLKIFYTFKRIIKTILYNLPKSFLIWFILLLLYVLFAGPKVQASTGSLSNNTTIQENVSINDLIFYDAVGFNEPVITDIIIDRTYDIDLTMNYIYFGKYEVPIGFGSNAYDNTWNGPKPDIFHLKNPNYRWRA